MRILVVNHYAASPGAAAGSRHLDLARCWASMGHQTEIVACSFNHFDQKTRFASVDDLSAAVRYRAIWSPGYRGNGLGRIGNLAFFATRVGMSRWGDPDVVIGSSPDPLSAVAAMRAARRSGAGFVYEVRDLWPETLIAMGALSREARATRALYAIERRLVEDADCVVGVMPGIADYFEERGLRARSVLWMPNASAVVSTEPSNLSEELRVIQRLQADGKFVITYVGSNGPANGLKTLVEAARICEEQGRPDIHFLLVGGGSERTACERQSASLSNCTLLGPVPKADVPPLLKSSDALVFHLLEASVFRFGISPNKLADYLVAERPVIYAGPRGRSAVDEVDDVVRAEPGNAKAVAEAALAISRWSPERVSSFALSARRAARRNSMEAVARSYAAALQVVTRRKLSAL